MPTPTITTDRRLARPCGEQKFGSLRACRMLCDVWTLARNARKLAFHPWARGRTAVVGSLCDAPIGSSTSSPATSQHGSSLDGSLLFARYGVGCSKTIWVSAACSQIEPQIDPNARRSRITWTSHAPQRLRPTRVSSRRITRATLTQRHSNSAIPARRLLSTA